MSQNPINYNDPVYKDRFYAGQTVICIIGRPYTGFDLHEEYVVSSYEYKANPVNGFFFWYVGIVGVHEWLRPTIFEAKLQNFKPITFEKVIESELVSEN